VMHLLVPALVRGMGAAYPELVRAQSMIEETLKLEETKFKQTLDRGLKLLDDELSHLDEGADLPGAAAFKLYDTYGFPLDLTQDALREKGRAVDVAGFDAAMAEQKTKARAAWSGIGAAADAKVWFELAEEHGVTEFLGYDTETAEGVVTALVRDGAGIAAASEGEVVQITVNQTPFYAESGGQVGDTGWIRTATGTGQVTDVKKAAGVFIHVAVVTEGTLTKGQPAKLEVSHIRRSHIRANHSATHLLHEALRRTLGDHVAQRGSLNAADRMRFDFSHTQAISAPDIATVEAEVNAFIRQNSAVETRIMTPDDARAIGAQALFGEKYGDEVRVVSMGALDGSAKGADRRTYSLELCGGTHVARTGDIGSFKILSQGSSSAGVRRIEAITGAAVESDVRENYGYIHELTLILGGLPHELPEKAKRLLSDRKALQNEVAQLRREVAMGGKAAGPEAKDINGVKFLAQVLTGVSGKDLPALIDEMKARLGSGAVLLIADTGAKPAVAAGVTADLTDRISAVTLARAAAEAMGGKGGGGRPDLAQAGGTDITEAEAAIRAAEAVLEGS